MQCRRRYPMYICYCPTHDDKAGNAAVETRKTKPRLHTLQALSQLGVSHGFEIAMKAKLKQGTVYGILMGFEKDGCVESRWEEPAPEGRPRRRFYRLTERGRQLLAEYEAHFGPQAALGLLGTIQCELHAAVDQTWGGMFQVSVRRTRERMQPAGRSSGRVARKSP